MVEVVLLDTIGGIVENWISKLQTVISLSITEEKYVARREASKEMILLQRFMEEIGKNHGNCNLHSDSIVYSSCKKFSLPFKNQTYIAHVPFHTFNFGR